MGVVSNSGVQLEKNQQNLLHNLQSRAVQGSSCVRRMNDGKGNGENEKNEALPISLFPPPSFCHAIPNNNPSAAYYRLYRSTSGQSSSGSADCSKGDPEDQVSAMCVGIVV